MLILFILSIVFCFYVMTAVSFSSSSLLVAIEQIRDEYNEQKARFKLVDELSRKEKKWSIIVYRMSFLVSLQGVAF